MTTFDRENHPDVPTILTPGEQRAVWFLGALIRVRAGGSATAGQLAILEHTGPRGYNSPLHRHKADEETFLILDGELRVEVGGQAVRAGPGTAAVLPRQIPHAFVVTSPQARFLTLHTPAGLRRVHAGRWITRLLPVRGPLGRTAARPGSAGRHRSLIRHRDPRAAAQPLLTGRHPPRHNRYGTPEESLMSPSKSKITQETAHTPGSGPFPYEGTR